MCSPMAAIGFGLSAASQVAGFAGQQQATDEYNRTAAQNAVNAKVAAANAYGDEQLKYSYDSKKNAQEAYDAVMKARQAKGIVQASAGSAGFDASSLSVSDLVSEQSRAEARDHYNFLTKQEDMSNNYDSRTKSIKAQAEGRINSMPYKSGPSALALGIGIAKSGFDSFSTTQQGKTWLGTS